MITTYVWPTYLGKQGRSRNPSGRHCTEGPPPRGGTDTARGHHIFRGELLPGYSHSLRRGRDVQRRLHPPSLHPQILSNLWFTYSPNPEDCILRGVKHLSWKDQRYHSETSRAGTGLQSTYNLLASTPMGTIVFPQTEPCLVKLQLHRFPSNDNLELNIFLPPFLRRKEMNIHLALISARRGFGGPHSACLNPPGMSPSQQAGCFQSYLSTSALAGR